MTALAESYLKDLAILLKDLSISARSIRDESRGSDGYDLALGRLMAYHEVLTLMRDQADAFGLDRGLLGLREFDPDDELLR